MNENFPNSTKDKTRESRISGQQNKLPKIILKQADNRKPKRIKS